MKKGLNIEVTSGQYEFLYDLVMMAYELDVPEQRGGICKHSIILLIMFAMLKRHISQTQ